ncbi:uncharacterized protein [Hyperolius riggenbachi]|uniref:uncharacterized protein n=1 Tax=Hyperolius riggenbachi TaxID=752182 RepID=UPI0035A3CFE2
MIVQKALMESIASLLEKKVIRQVPASHMHAGFYSPVFLVKKPKGDYRFIINLKSLNRFILYKRFRMDNMRTVVNLLQRDCYMVSLDLRDAYLHIPMSLRSQRFLRFAIRTAGESAQTTTIREAMSLLGLMTSAFMTMVWGQFHSRQLQVWILRVWNKKKSSLDDRVLIPPKVKLSLDWWKEQVHLSTGRLWNFPTECILTTDASAIGWGAHFKNMPAQGLWSQTLSSMPSNNRELEAVRLALEHFSSFLQMKHVLIQTDNSSVVAYLNRQGGTRSASLWSQTQRIMSWAEQWTCSLKAIHLKGSRNCMADFLSRETLLQDEWSLHQEVFQEILQKWGSPDIDLFASKHNNKCPQFCSLSREDNSKVIDAFSIKWEFPLVYAFPPITVIPKVLNKIMQEKVRAILITPFWPKRPWFSLLKRLAVEDPWILPNRPDLLSQGPFFHPQLTMFKLTAWNLNGHS